MSKFLRGSLIIFIIKRFRTIVFIFIVISPRFRPIFPPAFFMYFSELKIRPLLNPWVGGTCTYSVSHNRVQVLSIPVLLLACSQGWTYNLQMIVSLEAKGTNDYYPYAMCPAGHIFGIYNLNAFTRLGLLLLCMIFYLCPYSDFFFHPAFLIIGSHIVFNSILGLLSRSLKYIVYPYNLFFINVQIWKSNRCRDCFYW